MDSIIFRRNTRKGGRCMRGGRPLNRQIANLTKSIDYLTNRIRKPEYRRQIATNTAQIEKQTKERERLRQQQRLAEAETYALKAAANANIASNARAAKETARVAKENANKQRAINNAARNARIAATEQYALNAAANAKTASNARAAKETANVAATPSTGIFSAIQSTLGMSPSNPANTQTNLRDLIAQAEALSITLKKAANTARATMKGGKHRNRRTRRR
jgi:membrane protein involved in colicin uptake